MYARTWPVYVADERLNVDEFEERSNRLQATHNRPAREMFIADVGGGRGNEDCQCSSSCHPIFVWRAVSARERYLLFGRDKYNGMENKGKREISTYVQFYS